MSRGITISSVSMSREAARNLEQVSHTTPTSIVLADLRRLREGAVTPQALFVECLALGRGRVDGWRKYVEALAKAVEAR